MRVLVTGGAGYIGSHTCVELLNSGHEVCVIDNLCNGHEAALKRVQNITNCELQFFNADIRDVNVLNKIFGTFKPEAVIHFAGLKAVGESVADPLTYYAVNVGGSISLLAAMSEAKCNNIVFSSSATVYGIPEYLPYDEMHPTNPVNPYGKSKLIIENIINDWTNTDKKRTGTILRYFNPVGAHESGQIGEEPIGIPNNLMPFLAQVANGQREHLNIFGNNYDTSDGTGARDYIHIDDLVDAHVKSLKIIKKKKSEILNIGTGKAYTVLEIVKTFQNYLNYNIEYKYFKKRKGDLAIYFNNIKKSKKILDWEAKKNLKDMCSSIYRYGKK